ncbi:hypothetical protein BT96DRAFT_1003843 [Gymnopus androsaceus JB14]|uniref:Uncharacterized protein n=1 Tax=Gymnopus androsaceus JB14 TaxID=1447944 RepID=A0A6A4GTQ6_9AGAR|nr:hypothetical protein BT96DRAFT_1003843 [Gymnopus androsaceus JB14]
MADRHEPLQLKPTVLRTQQQNYDTADGYASNSNSMADTESIYNKSSDIEFMGAKCNVTEIQDTAEEEEPVYTGLNKHQIIAGGKSGQSADSPIDLTTMESIYEDSLGDFWYIVLQSLHVSYISKNGLGLG